MSIIRNVVLKKIESYYFETRVCHTGAPDNLYQLLRKANNFIFDILSLLIGFLLVTVSFVYTN